MNRVVRNFTNNRGINNPSKIKTFNNSCDENLKKSFEKIAIGNPPRAKINSILNFLIKSKILNTEWSKSQIIDEIYKRRVDKQLSFHLNVLYGLGSKGIHLNKKGIVSPVLFYPLMDYDQFKTIVQVMQVADKERKLGICEEKQFFENLFKK
ncbi:conserved Plasmodium protein, unknown function [Plasmodium chabaudi chabaudi]|uniref:Uncharacterized protein n=2 Tax=Plasmodium chabaudi TaxID=5825 RepID=A0A077YDB5_PLACU|nr:conserved Plasmodium protein, unknown function [Plasmodium chabaudi chabaudi]SCM03449.1 conserved Plasmodium protein, unknown function [Plasmodium chabaudi chabaudi]SCM10067.1 conserved Plasmodium protein, unknown function [Plasmodium chabaudi adami]VTZ66364.1 conserved Plasmodium protein, unknown function [Plasmodium chabaudi chabaudi]|eukprot:XP_741905.1 conserved Plasmodium protein, unknown function [Plasmodium chabaudi chabaudi]